MKAAIYETDTGSINRVATVPDSMIDLQIGPGELYAQLPADMNAIDDETHYIDLSGAEPAVAERAAISPTVSTSTGQADITGLPDPCEIVWGKQSAEATGGSATVAFDEPGTYTLTLRAEPAYLERTLEVVIP